MFNKKAIIKDYKKNLAMLSNKNFYKSVKRFMEMDLSDKSRIEIQNVLRNIINNDIYYIYKGFSTSIKFQNFVEGKMNRGSWNPIENAVILNNAFIDDPNVFSKFLLLDGYFHELQHAYQDNNQLSEEDLQNIEKIDSYNVLLKLNDDNLPYNSCPVEIDARIESVYRLMDLYNKEAVPFCPEFVVNIFENVMEILIGVNFFEDFENINNAKFEFNADKLFEELGVSIGEEELNTQLAQIEVISKQLVQKFINKYKSASVVFKNINSLSTAKQIDLVLKHIDLKNAGRMAHKDNIIKHIIDRKTKTYQKQKIASRNEVEYE